MICPFEDELLRLKAQNKTLRTQLRKSQAKRRKLLERVATLEAELKQTKVTGDGESPVAMTD